MVVVARRQEAQVVGDSLRWDGSHVPPGDQEVQVGLVDLVGVHPVVQSSIRDGCASEVAPMVQVPVAPTWCWCAH